MSIITWIILILVAISAGASGLAAWGWNRAKKNQIRANNAEKQLNSAEADIRRKNAALTTIADNAEKLKNEKTRISKSDLDQLIGHARELSDMVPEEHDSPGAGKGDDTDPGKAPISGALIG